MIWNHVPFPPSIRSLCDWAALLGDKGINPKPIKQYLSGIRSYQVDRGASKAELDIFHHPQLERIVAGIRRLRPAAQPRERRPISRSILKEIVSTFDQNSLRGATLHAAFCLAFAAFLRIGKFTWEENMWGDDFVCPMAHNQRFTITERGQITADPSRLQDGSLPARGHSYSSGRQRRSLPSPIIKKSD